LGELAVEEATVPSHSAAGASRTGRVLRGLGANVVTHVLELGRRFLLVPLFLRCWSDVRYGEWLALSASVGGLSLLDAGMQSYVVNRLRQCYSTSRLEEFHRVLHSGLRMALFACGVGVAAVTLFAWVAPVHSWIGLRHTDELTASLTVVLLGAYVVGRIPLGLVRGVYRAVGEYGRGGMVGNAILVSQVVLVVMALVVGAGFATVALAQLAAALAGSLLALADIRARHPEIVFGTGRGSWRLAVRMLGPSLFFLLITLAQVLGAQGTLVVVSIHLGGVAVALFATSRLLAGAVMKLTSVVRHSVWPEFTALQAQGHSEKLRDLHIALVKLCLMVTVPVCVALYFVGGEFYQFWTQKRLSFDPLLLALLLGCVSTSAVWQASAVVGLSSNRHRPIALSYVCAGVFGMGLCVLLVPAFGVHGAAAALWAGDAAARVVAIPGFTCRLLGQSPGEFWTRAVLRGVPSVMLTALAGFGASAATRGTPLHLVAVPAASAAAMAASGFLTWLAPSERSRAMGVLRLVRPLAGG